MGFGYFEAGFEFSVKNYPVSLVQTIISSKFDFLPPRAPLWGRIGGSQGPGAVEFCRPRRCRRVIIRAHPFSGQDTKGTSPHFEKSSCGNENSRRIEWKPLQAREIWVWEFNYATRSPWAAKFNRARPLGPSHGALEGPPGARNHEKN